MSNIDKIYYTLLEVDHDATSDEIRKSYKKLALACHPDKAGGSGKPFMELQTAYETLLDAAEHRAYDARLKAGLRYKLEEGCVHGKWTVLELKVWQCASCPAPNRIVGKCAHCGCLLCGLCREEIEAQHRRIKKRNAEIAGEEWWHHRTLNSRQERPDADDLTSVEYKKRTCVHEEGIEPGMCESLPCDICFDSCYLPRWRLYKHICKKCDRTVCEAHHWRMKEEIEQAQKKIEGTKRAAEKKVPLGVTGRQAKRQQKRKECPHTSWAAMGIVPEKCSFCKGTPRKDATYRCTACSTSACVGCMNKDREASQQIKEPSAQINAGPIPQAPNKGKTAIWADMVGGDV